MTRQFRNIIITLCVVAVLGGILAVIKFMPSGKSGKKSTSSSTAAISLLKLDTKNITSIAISNSSGQYAIRKSGSSWVVDTLGNVPQENVQSVVTATASLSASKIIASNVSDLGPYGLSNPQATADVTTADGKTTTIKIGNESPYGSSVYVSKSGDPNIYLSDDSAKNNYTAAALSYVSKSILSVNVSSDTGLSKMIFAGSGRTAPIQLDINQDSVKAASSSSSGSSSGASYDMSKPNKYQLDSNKVTTLTSALESFSAYAAVSLDVSDASLSNYGLKDPQYTFTFTYKGQTTQVDFGNTVNEEGTEYVYLYVHGRNVIYNIATSSVSFYNWQLSDIVSPNPFSAKIDDVKTISVEASGKTYNFDLNGTGTDLKVTYGNTTLNTDNFRHYYENLIGTNTSGGISSPSSGKTMLKVTFIYRNGAAQDVETYEQLDDYRVLFDLNGQGSLYFSKSSIDNLIQYTQDVADGKTVKSVI